MTLEGVREFIIPFNVVDQALEPLQEAGRYGYEAFVLLGGHFVGDHHFEFSTPYYPEQSMSRGAGGLLVVVDGTALFRANRAFYERRLILGGQIHSHPTAAYHSQTDDAYPIVTLLGGLSGVVPNFGDGGRDRLHEWAWYHLIGVGQWVPIGDETRITFR